MSAESILSAYAHKHIYTEVPAHTSIQTIQNLIYTQFKTGSKQRLETDENSSTERQSIVWGLFCFLYFEVRL